MFPAPARQSLAASNYQEALAINRESTGRGLSQQAWAIIPKIREIDELLRSSASLQGVMRECHPELEIIRDRPRFPFSTTKGVRVIKFNSLRPL